MNASKETKGAIMAEELKESLHSPVPPLYVLDVRYEFRKQLGIYFDHVCIFTLGKEVAVVISEPYDCRHAEGRMKVEDAAKRLGFSVDFQDFSEWYPGRTSRIVFYRPECEDCEPVRRYQKGGPRKLSEDAYVNNPYSHCRDALRRGLLPQRYENRA